MKKEESNTYNLIIMRHSQAFIVFSLINNRDMRESMFSGICGPAIILENLVDTKTGIYILAIPPPAGEFLSKLNNREEFEGGLEKRKEKGGKEEKKKRVIKYTLKYLYED